jgi:two-component system, OmpR family, response regulator
LKILLIDDDGERADVVRRGLAASGHVVDVESGANDAGYVAETRAYDAIVLDVMVAGEGGFGVARSLRARNARTPILMLTPSDTDDDAEPGLTGGAHEMLKKPFVFDELEARLRAITRREPALRRDAIAVGDLEMDLATRAVRRGERAIELSPRETAFLEYFMRNAGLLLTRKALKDALWERDRETVSNVIDAYVRRLRRKLSEGGEPQLIATVRGVGYRMRVRQH